MVTDHLKKMINVSIYIIAPGREPQLFKKHPVVSFTKENFMFIFVVPFSFCFVMEEQEESFEMSM